MGVERPSTDESLRERLAILDRHIETLQARVDQQGETMGARLGGLHQRPAKLPSNQLEQTLTTLVATLEVIRRRLVQTDRHGPQRQGP